MNTEAETVDFLREVKERAEDSREWPKRAKPFGFDFYSSALTVE